ncbi:Renal dipeptidase [Bacillus sp. MUM 116]|uniref:nucleotidyltransferase domain-containing protein n=1 Tax=Bacillus sp. MUM 116 TaxID=1678002 RepID=UPI0008F57F1E|nr:nucleotidyltransferase family protein [Bacillus sp. MUM 116]OIK09383.1 Renal dipeptidase [Bacillus sp. MUM 116]
MQKNFKLDVSRVPKELKLILKMIRQQDRIVEGEWFLNIDWNKFYELAIHHRVFPLLYPILERKYQQNIPEKITKAMGKEYQKNTFRMLHLTAELEQFSKLCSKNNIPFIVLKGPVLAQDLYGDLSLRTCGDLDVFISINNLEILDNLLQEQGYKKDEYIQTVLNDWKWRHHHFTYFHPVKNLKLEIHWRLHPGPGKEPSFKDLWERKRETILSNHPVCFLGREDLFLFLVSHGARHGWSRLRWLLDIHHISLQNVDIDKLKKLSKKHHNSHIVSQALILTNQLLGTNINEGYFKKFPNGKSSMLAQLAIFYLERMVNLHTDPVPKDVSRYHSRHLYSLMSFKQKIIYMISTLYPYPEDAQTLPLPKVFHFLYFPLRPFLWVWRKTKKMAVS